MAEPTALSTEDASLVRSRFAACVSAESSWRENALSDIRFKAGTNGKKSYQWDEASQSERETDNRPCFTVNRMDAFIKQITNQQRMAGPTITIAPAGEDGDEETAEVFQGIIRHILSVSDGEIAIDTAFEAAATHGKGFIYVTVDYIDEESGEQEILIKRVRNPFTVYLDPAASEPDSSDMRFAFVTDVIPRDEYTADYGDKFPLSALDMASIGDPQRLTWFPDGGVRIVEYFETVRTKTKKGRSKVKHVRWRKMNGLQTLAETKFPITRIPIVPMFGDEFDIDGDLDYRGMVRNGRHPQTILNYMFTSLVEQLALAPRSPFLVSATQLENFENIWKLANRKNFPYLPYNDKDAEGRPTGQPPIRNSVEPPIQSTVVALSIAENQFKAVMQLYDPSLGQGKRDMSGKAAQLYQQQGEIGNSNYTDNLKRSLRSLGRLLVQMIPKYYDAPRVMRILGRDEQPVTVMVHANKEADLPEVMPKGLDPKKIFNLGVGRYDVVVTTGPNFINKQQEQLATLLDIMKADPQIVPLVVDLVAKKMGADDVVERVRKIEPLKSLLAAESQQGPSPEQLQQKLQMMMQQHDALVQELDAKTKIIESDEIKADSQKAIKQLELESRERIAAYQGEVQMAINAAKLAGSQDVTLLKGKLDHLEMILTQAHDANEAATDRAHAIDQQQTQLAADAALAPPPNGNGQPAGAA